MILLVYHFTFVLIFLANRLLGRVIVLRDRRLINFLENLEYRFLEREYLLFLLLDFRLVADCFLGIARQRKAKRQYFLYVLAKFFVWTLGHIQNSPSLVSYNEKNEFKISRQLTSLFQEYWKQQIFKFHLVPHSRRSNQLIEFHRVQLRLAKWLDFPIYCGLWHHNSRSNGQVHYCSRQ